ncbi:aminotransferase class III-fold pyridoxal phosphate-dependent enzyme [Verticiella sediminum]|uniref:Aminotransferase class III-fold pyridoxal phosphate-dependent enzyme n=2 Tax=Verticiella sediminum TaxID=1247510 RepID=A0A556ASB8_9BURK|nr:aminotransferase class III-fold pyridoxal phosphate-dependent enzyme [Verticiella sediminum]
MPFTANRAFKKAPVLFASAEGMHYKTPEGRSVLDGTSGLWCVNAGHARQPILAAVRQQLAELDYAPGFQTGHPQAFAAARAVAARMPAGLDRIFFANSGSEAVDSALKIALAYHRADGQAQRTRLIGRERGYHGVGFGGISVGGLGANRQAFSGNLLPSVDHLPHTYDAERQRHSRGQPAWGAHLADELERRIALHGAHTIAAVIVEPVAGSAGVLVPPAGYLARLREITRRHGILLIFDEVITGFGRLGAPTASAYFDVTPDLITLAKGISNAVVPAGAVAVRREIHDTILDAAPDGAIEFAHGYTYSGHPLAAAAIQATLALYDEEELYARAGMLATDFELAVHRLDDAPHVQDVRNLGLMAGIDLAPRDGEPGARGRAVFQGCFERGVLVRYTGDTIALSPPLIAEPGQIEEIVRTLRSVLDGLA